MIGTLALAAILSTINPLGDPQSSIGLFQRDLLSCSTDKLAILGGLFLTLIGWSTGSASTTAERAGCLAVLISGLMFVGCSADLTTLFLSLELVSIPTYVLLGMAGNSSSHREATLKYFALSAFSSGLFLFGVSYLYGITGTTAIGPASAALRLAANPLIPIAWSMVLAGLAFRITAFPFHFYAPDVFAGTSTTMSAALSYLPKVAGLIAILRLIGTAATPLSANHVIVTTLLGLGILTMTIGNLLACVQTDIRRLLAYSSVAHSGYLLLGLAAVLHGASSNEPIFFYLASYAAMTLGLFAALQTIEADRSPVHELDELIGAAKSAPLAAATMVVCLLSLTGLPLTAGFWAKLQMIVISMSPADGLFRGAAILLTINAAIAASYYLPLIVRLYLPSPTAASAISGNIPATLASLLGAVLTIVWFFVPMG
jgi:NADH-quinone oxidoreductase subunit N